MNQRNDGRLFHRLVTEATSAAMKVSNITWNKRLYFAPYVVTHNHWHKTCFSTEQSQSLLLEISTIATFKSLLNTTQKFYHKFVSVYPASIQWQTNSKEVFHCKIGLSSCESYLHEGHKTQVEWELQWSALGLVLQRSDQQPTCSPLKHRCPSGNGSGNGTTFPTPKL